MRIRRIRLLGWIAAVGIALLAARPHAAERVSHPFAGVTYIDRTAASPRRVHLHIIQIDLATPGVRLKVSAPAGRREVVRETTLDFLEHEHAQAAINAHFFLPYPSDERDSWLVGLAASDGRVYSAFETPQQRYAIVADAPALNIDAANHASIVHRDPAWRDGLHVKEAVTLWNTVSGSAQIVTEGVKTIPAYADAGHPGALLLPGGSGHYSNEKSWYDVATARTAIGLSRDGRTLTLFTVDVREGSAGMRLGEVADMLLEDFGVWNAINLDGGGSTSIALEDPSTHRASLVNAPADDHPRGRAVGSSLAVFAPRDRSAPVHREATAIDTAIPLRFVALRCRCQRGTAHETAATKTRKHEDTP